MREKPNTYRGEPVRYDSAWVILRRRRTMPFWFPLESTVAPTREAAIRRFDEGEPPSSPYRYHRMRRRGEARAVRCRIVVDAV